MAVAGRIPRLSTTARRGVAALGLTAGTPRHRALFATVGALSRAAELPAPGDYLTRFAPGTANVRRVSRDNLWILYRFDAIFVDVVTVTHHPPVPIDTSDE